MKKEILWTSLMISFAEVVKLLRIHIEEGFKLTQKEIDQILHFLDEEDSIDDFVQLHSDCYRWIDLNSKDIDHNRLSGENQSWAYSLEGIKQFGRNQEIDFHGSLFIGDVYGINLSDLAECWDITPNKYINEHEILSLSKTSDIELVFSGSFWDIFLSTTSIA